VQIDESMQEEEAGCQISKLCVMMRASSINSVKCQPDAGNCEVAGIRMSNIGKYRDYGSSTWNVRLHSIHSMQQLAHFSFAHPFATLLKHIVS
jgi:hypothetical protein